MLINLHAHQLTYGMFDHDPHWGPAWENNTLRVGNWYLGNKKPNPTHPAEYFSRERQLERMEERGIDKLVVCQPAHMFMYWAGDFGTKFARIVNDELAAFCAQEPDKFYFWALAPMGDPEAAPAELERAVTDLGAVGMMMGGTNLNGHEVHQECYDPLWAKLTELGVPAFVHGYNQSAALDWHEDAFDLTSIVGMNYDETACVWNLICGGVLDRHPDLRFYVTHAGGFFPYHLGRFEQTNRTMAPDAVNERPVKEYLPSFYFDPDVHEPIMRKALVELIGPDNFVYGDNLGGSDNFQGDLTDGIGLSEEDREKIRGGNALGLLKRLSVEAPVGA
jgi:aminocarboxymuconate-semialdehyde decarboxylase